MRGTICLGYVRILEVRTVLDLWGGVRVRGGPHHDGRTNINVREDVCVCLCVVILLQPMLHCK